MSEEKPLEPLYYEPEKWVVLKDSIYAAQRAIRIGLEHINGEIRDCESLSNRSRRNDKYLEILKNEKVICEKALEDLKPKFLTE